MVPVLLILTPFVTGLLSFFWKDAKTAKNWALLSSVITAIITIVGVIGYPGQLLTFDANWLLAIGSRFALSMDGMGKMLCLLTGLSFPIIFLATYKNNYQKAGSFYALMLLTQAGLLGVFMASDALLFYFFWELALVPVYFLCSLWGGEKRIAVTFKFFIYTFIGSLLMLVGILFLYFHTPEQSFALKSFYQIKLAANQEGIIFWLFFIAFAIKMPIFPFHTWQPDAYEQSPTAVTMVLSGIMVKMGIFAVIRWILPIFPVASVKYANIIIILSVIGMLYASLIAIRQDDIKRLIAYSSIAHIGLMCAAMFTHNITGIQGVMVQMFNHGIIVIGLWIVADNIEQNLGTRKFSDLGGLAQKAPALSILLVIMALANIALPLTSAFIGEFLMFNGLFQYNIWLTAAAGISVILAAVYTLNMVQRILFGNTVPATMDAVDINQYTKWALSILVALVFVLGVYPQPLINLTSDTVNAILLTH